MKKYLFVVAACTIMSCGGSSEKQEYQSLEDIAGAEEVAAAEPVQGNPHTEGKDLIASSDCLACHKENEKLIGPSYQDVAERYEPNDSTITFLATKIIQGGAGNWGEVPMTPHPQFTQEQAEKMAQYILSLEQ